LLLLLLLLLLFAADCNAAAIYTAQMLPQFSQISNTHAYQSTLTNPASAAERVMLSHALPAASK
jgi:hypothetical protein